MPAHNWIPAAALAAAACYATGTTLVLLSRYHWERRRRLRQRVEALAAERPPAATARGHAPAALLTDMPTAALNSLVIEGALTPAAERLIAEILLWRVGRVRILHNARSRRRASRRIAALRVLALAGRPEAWACLERALQDGSSEVVSATVTLLRQLADRRAAVLLADLLLAGRYPRSRVATALENFTLAVPEIVEPLLACDNAAARYWATLLMRRYPSVEGVRTALPKLAQDADPMVRKAALAAAAAIGGSMAIGIAREALADRVSFVRAQAARTLGLLRAHDTAPHIAGLLADASWWPRAAAKQALEALGPAAASAVLPSLWHADSFARNSAAEVLQNIGVVDLLLLEEAIAPPDPRRTRLFQQLAEAGGPMALDGVLPKLPPEGQDRFRQLLADAALA
jgi:HEAT repeat protein